MPHPSLITPTKPTQEQVDAAVRWMIEDYAENEHGRTEAGFYQLDADELLIAIYDPYNHIYRKLSTRCALILAAHIWHQRNPQTT